MLLGSSICWYWWATLPSSRNIIRQLDHATNHRLARRHNGAHWRMFGPEVGIIRKLLLQYTDIAIPLMRMAFQIWWTSWLLSFSSISSLLIQITLSVKAICIYRRLRVELWYVRFRTCPPLNSIPPCTPDLGLFGLVYEAPRGPGGHLGAWQPMLLSREVKKKESSEVVKKLS